jgi:hypothetical protein
MSTPWLPDLFAARHCIPGASSTTPHCCRRLMPVLTTPSASSCRIRSVGMPVWRPFLKQTLGGVGELMPGGGVKLSPSPAKISSVCCPNNGAGTPTLQIFRRHS